MGFRFLVWNIEHFRHDNAARTAMVAEQIRAFQPDVFGILEFQAKKAARRLVRDHFPEYDFAFTDSKMAIEILVGWRRGRFAQVLYTQRRDLRETIHLRPGGLLSVRQPGQTRFDNLLFLHTDSGKSLTDYANRQKVFRKIWKIKSALQALPAQNNQARFIALGDMNTMGRKKTNTKKTIPAKDEVEKLKEDALKKGMRVLQKSHEKSWSNSSGSMKGELDHVIASNDLSFQTFQFVGEPGTFQIEVDGWVNLTGTARRNFIENISDHSLLFGEVL